jgi:hypothetical protein
VALCFPGGGEKLLGIGAEVLSMDNAAAHVTYCNLKQRQKELLGAVSAPAQVASLLQLAADIAAGTGLLHRLPNAMKMAMEVARKGHPASPADLGTLALE